MKTKERARDGQSRREVVVGMNVVLMVLGRLFGEEWFSGEFSMDAEWKWRGLQVSVRDGAEIQR